MAGSLEECGAAFSFTMACSLKECGAAQCGAAPIILHGRRDSGRNVSVGWLCAIRFCFFLGSIAEECEAASMERAWSHNLPLL